MKPVNLLPESQRRRSTSDSKSSYVILGVLAVLLAMSGLYVMTANQVTSRSDAAASASAEADRLEAQIASLGSFGNFAQIKETRVASVKQMASARFDWERLMLELARVLPSNGWLQAVDASTSGEVGDAPVDPTTTVSSGPTAKLTGCLPRQPDVADLMLRLGRMHRVEDVTLSESVREDAIGEPSISSCGRYYKFDISVAFAPSVAAEAPDGQSRVPAALGGGS
jgi:Tfp pilus assembly protein PilN